MYKPLIYLISAIVLISCSLEKQQADLIITNANIYTVNDQAQKAQAFAIKDGQFIGVGTSKEIKKLYRSDQVINLEGKTVLPGLIDGHCHFNNLGLFMQTVDLTGTNSFEEILKKVKAFQSKVFLSSVFRKTKRRQACLGP